MREVYVEIQLKYSCLIELYSLNTFINQIDSTRFSKKLRGVLELFIRYTSVGTQNIDSEIEDLPLKASEMRQVVQPAKAAFQTELNLDETGIIIESPEDYHKGEL